MHGSGAALVSYCRPLESSAIQSHVMESELDAVLRMLREAPERAAKIRIEVTDDYLDLIARVEAMPQNQPGADKSHVWPAMHAYVESFKNVRRIPRRP